MNLRRLSILHLKVYLGCHFKKHKKLQKTVIKKMYLTLQLMVHLRIQSRVHLWIYLNLMHSLYLIYSLHFRLDSIDEVHMRVKERGGWWGGGDEGSLGNRVIYWFNGAIFISKCIQGRLGIKKIWLVSAYVLYGWHLCKK